MAQDPNARKRRTAGANDYGGGAWAESERGQWWWGDGRGGRAGQECPGEPLVPSSRATAPYRHTPTPFDAPRASPAPSHAPRMGLVGYGLQGAMITEGITDRPHCKKKKINIFLLKMFVYVPSSSLC